MYKFILAIRYLIKRRITYLAIAAVALCVFMVVVVMTVMTGLVGDFKVNNHNWVGDCVVSSDSLVGFPYYEQFVEILGRTDIVEASSAVIKSYGILTTEDSDRNRSVEIMGINPVDHCSATDFGDTVHYHRNDCSNVFKPSYNQELPGCVLGIDLALVRNEYGRYTHTSQTPVYSFAISCFPLTSRGALAAADIGLVRTKTFYYSDSSHSFLARVDGAFVYLPFADAQMLCGMAGAGKRVNAIHIRFKDGVNLEAGCKHVRRLWADFIAAQSVRKHSDLLSKVRVESWKGYRRANIAAIEKEQVMMMVVFGMLGIIAVFIVLVVFYMIVSHKSKDVGILKSIGVANANIMKLFLYFAFLVGALGSLIGAGLAVLFLARINDLERWLYEHFGFQLWNRVIYAIDDIPSEVDSATVATICGFAVIVCFLGALLPSWQAAKKQPVETLQVSQI